MLSKFKYGDRVKAGKNLGKVVSIRRGTVGHFCMVKFDNQRLIPDEMEYKEEELEFEDGRTIGCPICRTPWHEVRFGNNLWKDCLKCNKKEEDIIEMQKSKTKPDFTGKTKPPGFYSNQELVDEIQKSLDADYDDYDDDDFGLFFKM